MRPFLIKITNKIINLFEFVLKGKMFGEKPENAVFVKPTYYIIDSLNSESLIIDVGTGNDADFSRSLMNKYNLKSYGFDPTIKHQELLRKLEEESGGKFTISPFALSDKTGETQFNESKNNISGSFSSDHVNIKKDSVNKYKVKTITLKDIFLKLNITKADIVKIDIEGAEYDVINSLTKDLTDQIDQFVFEFHHHCIDKYSILDNLKAIKKLESLGFKKYSKDGINYLFYR